MSTEQHPIIEQAKTQGRIRQDVSLIVQEELSLAGVTEASFAELKEHAESLADLQVIGKASLADVQEVITKCVRMKTTIKQAIEPGKKHAHQLHKAYTSNENEFIATVEAIEEPLKAKKQAYLDRIEREEAERLRQIQEMQEERKALIMGTGAVFVQGPPAHKYVLGSTEVTVREVIEADHETWTNLLRSFEIVAAELADLRAQEERQQRELAERLEQQAKAQQEAAAEIERRQRELEEKEEKMREAVNEARRNELLAAGCALYDGGDSISVVRMVEPQHGEVYFYVKAQGLHSWTQEYFQERLTEAKKAVAMRDEDDRIAQEKAAREALVQERVERLKAAGWKENGFEIDLFVPTGVHRMAVDQIGSAEESTIEDMVEAGQAELARREAAHQEQLRVEAEAAARVRLEAEQVAAAKAEAERVAKMGDEERWDEWVRSIQASTPKMEHPEYTERVTRVLYAIQQNDPTF